MIIKKALFASLVVVVFFFIYNPPLYFLPMNAGIMVGIVFFCLYCLQILASLILNKSIVINRSLLQLMFAIGFIVLYAFFISVINFSFDTQVFKSYLSFLLFYIPGAFGIVKIAKKSFTPLAIIEMFVLATVIQSVVIVIMLINPSFKDFLFSLLRDGDTRIEKNLMMGGFRFLGFAFNSTWDLSIVQSLGLMFISLMIKLDKKQLNFKNVFFFLLLSISIFLTGRTGFIGLVLALLILVIPDNLREIPFLRFTGFWLRMIILIVPATILVIALLPRDVYEIVEKNVVPWAFELFENDSGGKLETESSNELKTMYFMPSVKTLIFGDGYYVSPFDSTRYYMDTDAGYMRHVLYYGVIGCFFIVTIYLILFYRIYKLSKQLAELRSLKIFCIFLAFYFLLSHVKGDLLMGADMPIKAIFLLLAILMIKSPVNNVKDV
jgi:hypothetical protein